ncbi:MAG: MEDS domain-containing protein [Dehalococcoidia bacterium]
MEEEPRDSGIDVIGSVPWGTHFCQFYRTKQDLVDILVPYFRTGLQNNEFCMWITAEPLNTSSARAALKRVVPDLDRYIEKGQIEIIPHTKWYLLGGTFDDERVLNAWITKLERALEHGYSGLRLSGNTFWLERNGWQAFTDYEAKINNAIGKYKMLALCTYYLDKCNGADVIDVVKNHQFALIKEEGKWDMIESSIYRQAKEALKASEEKYRDLFTNMTVGFAFCEIITDYNGKPVDYRILEVNQAWEKLTVLSDAQVIGKRIREIIPELEQYWVDTYGKVALTQEPVHIENYSELTGNWYEINAYSPQKGYFVSLVENISERKKMEQQLVGQAALLQTIMANTGAKLVYLDRDFNFLMANKAYLDSCGHSWEALERKNHFYFFPHPENEAVFCKVRDTGEPVSFHDKPFEYADQPQRGITYWDWTLVPVKDSSNRVTGLVLSLIETTERKKAEDALQESEKRLRIVADFAHDWEYWRTEGNRFVYMSPSCLRLTGYTSQQFIDNPGLYLSIIHPDDRERISEHMKSDLHHREAMALEFRIIRRDGQERWVDHVCQPVLDEKGNILGRRSSNRDVTERKQMEAELDEHRRRLEEMVQERTSQLMDKVERLTEAEQKIRALSQRLLDVQEKERRELGHALHDEVGGNLTALKLAVNRARRRHSEVAARALEEADQIIDELIDQIRFISHSIRPSVLDDYGLLEALRWYLERYQERTGVAINFTHDRLETRLPPQIETAAYRIVQEALTNAVRHSGARSIDVGLSEQDGLLMISVTDDGRGFDPSKITSGTGIAGMQDLAELAGGSLSVVSGLGEGTWISCGLPVGLQNS